MVRASVTVDLLTADAHALAAVLPEVYRRWHALEFDATGVALIGGTRREGLRLTDGTHARAGARYRAAVTTRIAVYRYECAITSENPDSFECVSENIRIQSRIQYNEVHFEHWSSRPGLGFLGRDSTATGSFHADAITRGGQAAIGEVVFRRLRASLTAHVTPRGDRLSVRVRVRMSARGLLVLGLPFLWPMLKRELRRSSAEAVARLRAAVADGTLPNQVWAALTTDIAARVPD